MKFSIVIPNFNGEKLLERNLPKVLSLVKDYDCEVVVYDDASTDNSLEVLKKFKVKVGIADKNRGFSSSVNKGVDLARGEIIILINTDVYPENDFLKGLEEKFKNSNVFAVGFLDKSIENGKIIERGRGLGVWKRGFLVHRRGEVDKTSTLWVSGGSGAFRKDIWDKLGGLNVLYNPFYWEDIDISYRALKSGYQIYFDPERKVVHEHEEGSIKSKFNVKKIKEISYRNQFIFSWSNATDYTLQLAEFLWLPYHLIKALFRMDWQLIFGFFDALILLPKVIKSSLRYQKLFVKKDSEVIKDLSI